MGQTAFDELNLSGLKSRPGWVGWRRGGGSGGLSWENMQPLMGLKGHINVNLKPIRLCGKAKSL